MKDSELFVEDAIGDWACKHEVLDRTEIKYVIRRCEAASTAEPDEFSSTAKCTSLCGSCLIVLLLSSLEAMSDTVTGFLNDAGRWQKTESGACFPLGFCIDIHQPQAGNGAHVAG